MAGCFGALCLSFFYETPVVAHLVHLPCSSVETGRALSTEPGIWGHWSLLAVNTVLCLEVSGGGRELGECDPGLCLGDAREVEAEGRRWMDRVSGSVDTGTCLAGLALGAYYSFCTGCLFHLCPLGWLPGKSQEEALQGDLAPTGQGLPVLGETGPGHLALSGSCFSREGQARSSLL